MVAAPERVQGGTLRIEEDTSMVTSGDGQQLVMVTLLPDGDDAGVVRHVETIAAAAPGWGAEPTVVNPWRRGRVIRFAFSRLGRVVGWVSRPHGRTVGRLGLEAVVTMQLVRVLLAARGSVCVYAQDPTSATIALRVRRILTIDRVVAIAHMNGSEWEEHIARGTARAGDAMTRMLRRRERRMVAGADLIIAPSRHSLRQITHRYPSVPQARFLVLHHAVPLPDPITGDPGELVTIGTLEPRKRHCYLLEVVAAAAGRGRALQLTIIGDGELRQQLEDLADSLGIARSVRFLGRVVPAAGHLARHKVYVHAARTESFGLVIAEAMGFGLPVLAGGVGAIPELVRDGVDGLLWPLDDADRAAAMLLELLDDPVRFEGMRVSAQDRHRTSFSPEAVLPLWRGAILDHPSIAPDDGPEGGDAVSDRTGPGR